MYQKKKQNNNNDGDDEFSPSQTMKSKICTICKTKFIENSNNQKYCSELCRKIVLIEQHDKSRKKYRIIHKEKIKKQLKKYYQEHKEEIRKHQKIYRNSHREELKKYNKKYQILNRLKIKKIKRIYNKIHKKELALARKKHKNSDINFKLACNLRSRIWDVLYRTKKSNSTEILLGCSIEKLKQYLESQFAEGMSWKNYGRGYNGKKQWHIDHIKPCDSFDLPKPKEQCKCFHYTNLQPLWAEDNLRKYIK